MRTGFVISVWLCVGAAVAGFFLPWARIELQESATLPLPSLGPLTAEHIEVQIRRESQIITGDLRSLAQVPRQLSGFQIPQFVNQALAQAAIALAEVFTHKRQRPELKSYAVYLLPGLAILCGVLMTTWGTRPSVAIGVATLCTVVAAAGFWTLLTRDTHVPFVTVTIGPGLWLSLWAYVALAGCTALHIAVRRRPA